MADGFQAAQNWAIFLAIAAGVAWYYYPKQKQAPKIAPARETKAEVKKPARKNTYAEKAAAPPSATEDSKTETKASQNGAKKRKANTQAPIQTPAAPSAEQADGEGIDDSTRHFAEQMMRAKNGTDLKKSDSKETRVKTVKPKSNTNALSSGSSVADEEDWSPASAAARASGIDDMLEPEAAGPSALRITAPSKPVKEKVNAPKKEAVVETKKQRQNRQKREAAKEERSEADKEQKAKQEAQRRAARVARGEPARNGVPVAPAPVNSPWAERNAARDEQNPIVVSSGGQSQLLDTFDVESNSSSNAEVSTAATSTTDHAPNEVFLENDDLQRAIDESNLDSGWSHVSSKKQNKKKSQQDGDSTPVQQAANTSDAKSKPTARPTGFLALNDDAE